MLIIKKLYNTSDSKLTIMIVKKRIKEIVNEFKTAGARCDIQ